MTSPKNGLEISIYEKDLAKKFPKVIGIDEVGRGCFAGPMIVGAYAITKISEEIGGVMDSKLINKKNRELLYPILTKNEHKIVEISAESIDKDGLTLGFKNAIKEIVQYFGNDSYYLVDGNLKFEQKNIQSVIDGDNKVFSIAAASIIAKVYRDKIMYDYAKKYPHYGFDTNVGYGTKQHREAIASQGILDIHRKSYTPIKKLLENK